MKELRNRYLHGLYNLFHHIGNPDPDLGVIFCIMVMQIFLLFDISIIFDFRIPTTEAFGAKYTWIVRMVAGSIIALINSYVFGVRESIYSDYPPLSKRTTLLITFIYCAITLGFFIYKVAHR